MAQMAQRNLIPASVMLTLAEYDEVKRKLEVAGSGPSQQRHDWNDILWLAVASDEREVCSTAIRNGADITWQKPCMGTNALHLAAYLDRYDIVADMLRSCGLPTVDLKDDWGLTPLFVAWMNNSKKSVDCLLQAAADSSQATPWKFTNECIALSAECASNQIMIDGCFVPDYFYRILFGDSMGSLTARELYFWTNFLLWWEAGKGNDIKCNNLLRMQADPSATVWTHPAIHHAAWRRQNSVISLFQHRGASMDLEDRWAITVHQVKNGMANQDCFLQTLLSFSDNSHIDYCSRCLRNPNRTHGSFCLHCSYRNNSPVSSCPHCKYRCCIRTEYCYRCSFDPTHCDSCQRCSYDSNSPPSFCHNCKCSC